MPLVYSRLPLFMSVCVTVCLQLEDYSRDDEPHMSFDEQEMRARDESDCLLRESLFVCLDSRRRRKEMSRRVKG